MKSPRLTELKTDPMSIKGAEVRQLIALVEAQLAYIDALRTQPVNDDSLDSKSQKVADVWLVFNGVQS